MYTKSVFSLVNILLLLCISHASNAQNAKPDNILLPAGFQPEGITLGVGPQILAGSLADGSIYSVDLIKGNGNIVIPPQTPRIAVGLSFDQRSRSLFVAGGPSGAAYIYDPSTGQEVANYQLGPPQGDSFINDVIVTREAAYFTDSFQPFIYRLSLGPGGKLPDPTSGPVDEIFLGGDFTFIPGTFNANGIEASPDGRWLLVINSVTSELYRVDPDNGDATIRIDLGGNSLPAGDGIVREGLTLYVVQNRLNQISVIKLAPDFASGEVVSTITDEDFDVPSTAAIFDGSLYAVNARFGTAPTPTTTYSIVAVPK
jgi:sugar lactone lactonase YvrE